MRGQTVRVEYPPSEGYPDGSHTLHDTDDGNIQYRDTKPIEESTDTDELNDVLNKVATETSGRKVTHKLKTRPDRWEGQQGSCTRDNRPYLSYQKIRWARILPVR